MSTAPVKPTAGGTAEMVAERFRRLASAGHRDTDYLSSMDDAASHPAYQEIARLGPEVRCE